MTGTNPVAALAALLQQAISTHGKNWKRAAEYLVARGVQYAPGDPFPTRPHPPETLRVIDEIHPWPSDWPPLSEEEELAVLREFVSKMRDPQAIPELKHLNAMILRRDEPSAECGICYSLRKLLRGRPEGPSAPPEPEGGQV